MKKIAVYLVLVLLMLGGCEYFSTDTDYSMDPFDEAACYTVDKGLTAGKTLTALNDPYFLDDKNVDALVAGTDEMQTIETRVKVVVASGDLDVSDSDPAATTYAFANIENYYDSVTAIELYMHKVKATVDSLLSGESYDDVIFSEAFEADINSTFDSVYTVETQRDFTIEDEMSKYDFFIKAQRSLYGKNGKIPAFELREKPWRVTCAAVEVMSLYSYLDIGPEEAGLITFYFNEYMSMRIWNEDGERIPMLDNSIDLEMASSFSGRADETEGKVLAKCQYELDEGRYLVRWIRGESTKSSSQFSSTPESTANYFKFHVGIFPADYEADTETIDIADKLFAPTDTIRLRSPFQCDTSLWEEDENLTVSRLLTNPEQMIALRQGLDSVSFNDFDKGIYLKYDQELPQNLFFFTLEDTIDIDTMRIYLDGGSFTMYDKVFALPTGGVNFGTFSPNVTGVTFKEMFVSPNISKVLYMYNFKENLYLVSVKYEGEAEGINMVLKGN